VVRSLSKSINGHADIVGGMVVTRDERLYKPLRAMLVSLGCNMDPTQVRGADQRSTGV
jgi:methionine-gamma-lyase